MSWRALFVSHDGQFFIKYGPQTQHAEGVEIRQPCLLIGDTVLRRELWSAPGVGTTENDGLSGRNGREAKIRKFYHVSREDESVFRLDVTVNNAWQRKCVSVVFVLGVMGTE